MARPYIEFVQCQNIDWQVQADGTRVKRLNFDPADGAETCIVRYPAGFIREDMGPEDRAEEYFVLDGTIVIDEKARAYHAYGFIPRGESAGIRASEQGATLLIFRYGRDDPNSISGVSEAITVDPLSVPWDMSASDPQIAHLRLARKVMRLGPNDSSRTFLLLGLPHGVPPADAMPAETHDHFEEMLMLQGEMWTPEGLIRPGAYFYRPPGIVHGPHVSQAGFFQIMRAGANKVRTEWSAPKPLPIGAPYAPAIPEGTPESWTRPWDGPEAF
ncbi:cupin domain-containing protein [Sphingobium boeckii]|uniref:ChrR-like cupin domain-containing protein n=1 Tax=Sphingobium boeckii TaxID=1082345 RepID=A0A7W9EH25_9SPHN|nr:hypothetical protein [Sphingobium boeckii]MBB5687695.1 hypothetical protein [Sphingobium boeckii]